MIIRGHILIRKDTFWCARTNLDTRGHILIHVDTFWYTGTHFDTPGHIFIHGDAFWYTRTHYDARGHILIHDDTREENTRILGHENTPWHITIHNVKKIREATKKWYVETSLNQIISTKKSSDREKNLLVYWAFTFYLMRKYQSTSTKHKTYTWQTLKEA